MRGPLVYILGIVFASFILKNLSKSVIDVQTVRSGWASVQLPFNRSMERVKKGSGNECAAA